VSAAED